ncbi:MAG: pyridoxal phosphate-dependent aminotransferase [Melioribacteraceae bacterium]|nr:pyridoxal phosphate-dependent aminotransferase [Melioribacteraceae bacterium]
MRMGELSVCKRIDKVGVSPTMKVAGEAKAMKARGEDVIDLSVGEPDFPTPQNIKDAAKRAIDEEHTKYTINAGTVELRKAIQQSLKRDHNLDYELNEIIASNGAKQSVYNTIMATVHVDDEVIIPAPYWVSYPQMVTLAHGTPVIITTTEETGFKITPKQLEDAITPYTRAMILCNPSNPTGSAYTRDELEEIATIVSRHHIFVIADEIYEKLTYDDFKFTSFASLSDDAKNRTILINGVSKAYAMTGWRLGYTAAQKNVVDGINKLQSHSTSHASSISQQAAIEALTGPQDILEKMRKEFERRRNYLHEKLNNIDGISALKPEGAFYLFPNISDLLHHNSKVFKIKNSFDFAMHLLKEAKIAVVPGSAFGSEGHLRVSYANSMENLERAVERITKAVEMLH